MLIDVSTDDYKREYILLKEAFNKARETEDPILAEFSLIPLRPDPTISAGNIVQAAKE